MTNRQRFQAVLHFEKPDDRLPVMEWAPWWDRTVEAWRQQGLPGDLDWFGIRDYLGLDPHYQINLSCATAQLPRPAYFGGPLMEDEADYEALLPFLYRDSLIEDGLRELEKYAQGHRRGDYPLWITLPGCFWFPRELWGIENHLFAFYDRPELYRRILKDLAQYQVRLLERVYEVVTPDFMTFAEDMSYNKGPMISEELFDTVLAPFYRTVVPVLHSHGTRVIMDSDGDVSRMIPWMQRVGIQGVLPLERKAGVDIAALREQYPDFLFIGAFDKMTMREGTGAMEQEFRRLLPTMKKGGFIPSVDHQTPPDCSLERYRDYVQMLREYAYLAVR